MKFGAVLLLLLDLHALAGAQESAIIKEGASSSIRLEIGQRAPAFTLRDQLGHEQSNETLRGSNGTIVLFFRSAASQATRPAVPKSFRSPTAIPSSPNCRSPD